MEIIDEAKSAGFLVESFIEPKPTEEMKDNSPETYKKLNN